MAHSVSLAMPAGPLPARSFVRIPVTIATGSGLGFSDLEFVLPDGLPAGRTSVAPDATLPGDALVLLVGFARGSHELIAVDRRNGTLVGQGKFEISDGTAGFDGPSRWSTT